MTSPNTRPAPEPQRVRPYAMTGGRTRPTHDDLEIEALVSTTGRPTQAIVPTWPCWNRCSTGCAPSDEDFGLPDASIERTLLSALAPDACG